MNRRDIKGFLNEGRNSKIRESIFKYRLCYDLKMAGAFYKCHLKVYEQEVDNEGCDIIMEDETDFSRKIQLKSTFETKTSEWKIHKSILKPAFSQMADYQFDSILCPTTPGGVILIDAILDSKSKIDKDLNSISFAYSYTDINIISLISLGIIDRKEKTKAYANSILNKLRILNGEKSVIIKRGLFIKVNSSSSLIDVLGFCGQSDFVFNANKYIRNQFNKAKFFRDEIPDYNAYETSEQVFENWHQKWLLSNKAHFLQMRESWKAISSSSELCKNG